MTGWRSGQYPAAAGGLLGPAPRGAELFPGDHLDATGRLAELFGFTALAHLTVREGETFQGDKPEPDEREDRPAETEA